MDARLQKIRQQWPDNRLLALKGVGEDNTPDDIFQCVVMADPTRQHKYVAWTLKAWENGGLQFEDIALGSESKTAETLSEFEKYKSRIGNPKYENDISGITLRDAKDRSLLRYKVPGDLYKAVRPWVVAEQKYGETASSREQKRLDMMKARLESYHETMESGITIDIPSTVFAAQKLGYQTKWCTSALENNMFEDYAEKGDLYIITLPTGERFQAHSKVDVPDEEDDEDYDLDDEEELEEDDDDIDYTKSALLAFKHYVHLKGMSKFEFVDISEDENDVVRSIVQRMDFMDEADSEINSENGKALRPYQKELAHILSGLLVKSITTKMMSPHISDDIIADFTKKLSQQIELSLEHQCKRPSAGLSEPKSILPHPETVPTILEDDPSPRCDLFDKLEGNNAFVIKDGVKTLNLEDGMTIVDYVKKYTGILADHIPTFQPEDDISSLEDFKELFKDTLDSVSLSQEMADEVVKSVELLTLDNLFSHQKIHLKERNLFSLIVVLVAKQRLEMPHFINNTEDKKGIIADIEIQDGYPNYISQILFSCAPTSFLENYIRNGVSMDRAVEVLKKRMKDEGMSDITTFEKLIKIGTDNMKIEGEDTLTKEEINEIKMGRITDTISEYINNHLHKRNKQYDVSDVRRLTGIIRETIAEKLPQDYIKGALLNVFDQTFGCETSDYNTVVWLNNKDYKLFYEHMVGGAEKCPIPRIVQNLDQGFLTDEDIKDLKDIKRHGPKIKEMGYRNFPERYQDVFCMLENLNEDQGVHYDEIGTKTTQKSGIPSTLSSTRNNDVVNKFCTISSCVSHPTKEFLDCLTEKKEQFLKQGNKLTSGQRNELTELHIKALEMEDVLNKRIHDVISLLENHGIVTPDEVVAMREEKPMNVRLIEWIGQDLEKTSEQERSIPMLS